MTKMATSVQEQLTQHLGASQKAAEQLQKQMQLLGAMPLTAEPTSVQERYEAKKQSIRRNKMRARFVTALREAGATPAQQIAAIEKDLHDDNMDQMILYPNIVEAGIRQVIQGLREGDYDV